MEKDGGGDYEVHLVSDDRAQRVETQTQRYEATNRARRIV